MKTPLSDPQFAFEWLRTIGYAAGGGADIGECLTAAERIEPGDENSWYAQWSALADRVRGLADASLASGRNVSAREGYLRASNYYRCAEFFLHRNPGDPRILETWAKSRESFRFAGELFATPSEAVEIPYEGTTLPGYFWRVDSSGLRRPTLILNTGFDGTAEELYFSAKAGLERGYNCLAFEGPGQGGVIRRQKIYFRPDWEQVVTPAIDFLLERQDVDRRRIALIGYSLGGYFAPRAAAFDRRISACVANGGVFDMLEGVMAKQSVLPLEIKQFAVESPGELDKMMAEKAAADTEMRWGLADGLWKFGVAAPHEWILKMAEYSLDGLAQEIKCPTLVCDSQADKSFPGQSQRLFDALTCRKKLVAFTADEGAADHCQVGAAFLSAQRTFDWLDEIFAVGAARRAA